MKDISKYWSVPESEIFQSLESSAKGLSSADAEKRKKNILKDKVVSPLKKDLLLFYGQFKNPLVLLLVVALILSASLGELTNSIIIFSVLMITGLLGFFQERNAGRAVEKLRALVQTKASVLRDGKKIDLTAGELVPGDIFYLDAGDMIPADGRIIDAKDLYVNEATLTGESFPSEKKCGTISSDAALAKMNNVVFRGTNVISGTAIVIAVATGKSSQLGQIEKEIDSVTEITAFEQSIKKFGYMLMRVALIMSGIILIVNLSLGKPPLDSVLFALALSVGLAPELLPAILTITLSAGARRLAKKKVIVKKLASIQNLGSIDILCTDKTGTLTEGEVKIQSVCDMDGTESAFIRQYAYLNAFHESGYPNPMDEAIRKDCKTDIAEFKKFDEVPYDFIRRRLSVVVEKGNQHIMITKGALKNILEVCTKVQMKDGSLKEINSVKEEINKRYATFSADGYRTIGICMKDVTGDPVINKEDETEMIFLGFILMSDPIKQGIPEVIEDLQSKSISLKIITGDNRLIAEKVSAQLGMKNPVILTGSEMHQMTEEALVNRVKDTDIFAETEPLQKENIVRALQQSGHVVGYMGDGINDASALKAADVGISVNNAADVAKEAADVILLEKDLAVLSEGISEGRKTYQNTLKYIFITISANFGNMFSMAGASLFLPFLPLLPSQILLLNFLTDLPALAISSDTVDIELLKQPRKWNMKLITRFMIVFGLESSLFDYVAFGILILMFKSNEATFQTGWFMESTITEVIVLLIIRTRRLFFRSLPGKYLLITGIGVCAAVLIIPYLGFAPLLGFTPLQGKIVFAMIVTAFGFAVLLEITKRIFFRKMHY